MRHAVEDASASTVTARTDEMPVGIVGLATAGRFVNASVRRWERAWWLPPAGTPPERQTLIAVRFMGCGIGLPSAGGPRYIAQVTAHRVTSQYHAEERLRDGRCVWLRAIQPSDRDLLREGLHHLSPQSAYRRFFSAKRELSDRELDYLTQLDFVNHVELAAFVDDGSGPLLVGTASYIVEHPEVRPKSAEVAFVVGDAHQRLGIGGVLLRHLVAIARANGLPALHALVLAENRPMISVFRKSGLPMMTTYAEPGVLEVSLKLAP